MQTTVVKNYMRPDLAQGSGEIALTSDSQAMFIDGNTVSDSLHSAVKKIVTENLQSPSENYEFGWWYVGSGRPPLPDPSDHLMFGYRHTKKTPNFKERCSQGEILMNDYSVCKGTLTYGPSDRSELLYDQFRYYAYELDIRTRFTVDENHLYFVPDGARFAPMAFANGTWRRTNTGLYSVSWPVWQKATTVGLPHDSRLHLGAVSEYLQSLPQELEHSTVQEVLAKANGGDLDVLTSLAEMPELIKSIIDGFNLLKKILLDARKKEFRLFATVPTRERRLASEAFAKKKARALRNIPTFNRWVKRRSNRGKTLSDYAIWRSDRIASIGNLESFIAGKGSVYRKRALREIAEALSSLHLNVMYNIKPTVYMIEDSLKAIDNFSTVYRRYGNGNTPVTRNINLSLPGIPEAKFVGSAYSEFRCLIKRRYATEDVMSKINNVLTTDLLVTGFEIIKLWSIVFDWFFSISDALRAIPWNRSYMQQASCVSWKTVIDGSFQWKQGATSHTLKVEMERFERSLYNPVHSIGIYFRDNFGLYQQLSALAFSFQAVNGSIRKRYSYS